MKEPNAYIFTPRTNHLKKLCREVIPTDSNKVRHKVSRILSDQPNIMTHSFRIGSITQLWKDTKDIANKSSGTKDWIQLLLTLTNYLNYELKPRQYFQYLLESRLENYIFN